MESHLHFQLTDQSFQHLAQNCYHLNVLNLQGCTVSPLSSYWRLVETLFTSVTLDPFQSITDECIVAISEHCPELTSLCVSNCSHLTDASLVALGQGCHLLRWGSSSGQPPTWAVLPRPSFETVLQRWCLFAEPYWYQYIRCSPPSFVCN